MYSPRDLLCPPLLAVLVAAHPIGVIAVPEAPYLHFLGLPSLDPDWQDHILYTYVMYIRNSMSRTGNKQSQKAKFYDRDRKREKSIPQKIKELRINLSLYSSGQNA